jgi:hypothetical protein
MLYGSEYEENILASDSANEDVPCAVCRSTTTQTSIMIPERETCYCGVIQHTFLPLNFRMNQMQMSIISL